MQKNKSNHQTNQTYNPVKEAEEVLTVKSQYVSGEKYNSMPVEGEEHLKEQ